ncbi:MAG: zinc metallopeptidase [Pirellulales bacterium]
MFFDWLMFLFIAPAVLLALVAQGMVSSAYSRMSRVAARMSGYAAARRILDRAGLQDVPVEVVPGHLSDHYDPTHRVLRLSPEVYEGQSMAAVGIAAHEAGHALQHAQRYALMGIRSAAVPMAGLGSGLGAMLASLGVFLTMSAVPAGKLVLLAGIVLFAGVVVFQLVNLPVEFDASARAKRLLVSEGILRQDEVPYVSQVLNAAALTYVAATLQSILQLAYFLFRFMGSQNRDE